MNACHFSDLMLKNQSSNSTLSINDTYDRKNALIETYPWIIDFRKKCFTELMNSNMRNLMKLIKLYLGNISKAVEDCYQRPKRALKLKMEMSNTLTFFHYSYKEIKTPLEHFSFLEKMSDLMAMYVDMEIKASRNGIESIKKVASMITSSLKLYFGKYQEYILDSILKTNLITKRYRVLGGLIFRWVLRDSPDLPLDIISYIRYILAFKMWKEIVAGSKDEQQLISKLACKRLEPPVDLKEKLESIQSLRDLFPILPNSDITKFLMKAKFSSREKAKVFYKALSSPLVVTTLNYTSIPFKGYSKSVFCKKGKNKVDQLMNNLWASLSGNKIINSCLMNNISTNDCNEVIKNSKFKQKRKDVNYDIKSKQNIKPFENLSLGGEDKHFIKLEIDDVLTCITDENLFQYEHSIEDIFHVEEENKDLLCWKSDLDVKKVIENDVNEDKLDELQLETSESSLKSNLEDETLGSSNECLFDLKDDLTVDGEKGDEDQNFSSLPLKKRRGFPYNKYVQNDNTDVSDKVIRDHEERNMIFKTPAQLKAFSDSFYESTGLINLALRSDSVYSPHDLSYPVRMEADSVTGNSLPPVIKKKASRKMKGRRRKGRGKMKKKKLEQAEDANTLLAELATTAGFFK